MTKSAMINTRLEPKLKKSSEAILAKIGLSTSEAITLFLSQVVMHRGLPFPARIPNAETRKALQEAKEGRNLTSYDDFDDYLKSIK
jgi:DNA-damage-inducible protein J